MTSEPILGRHDDVPEDVYHNGPGVSASGLKRILRSPAYFKHAPPLRGDDLDTGSAFHCATLEPQHYAARFHAWEGRRQGKAYDEHRAAHPGVTMLTQAQHETAMVMAEAVHRHSFAGALVGEDPGPVETSLYWLDETTRRLCRARPDKLCANHDIIVDLKSTTNASANAFARSAANLRYDMSAALYARGYQAIMRKPLGAYIFVVVEKEPPWQVGLYVLGEEELARGARLVDHALAIYDKCAREDTWPGLPSEIVELRYPRWAFNLEDL